MKNKYTGRIEDITAEERFHIDVLVGITLNCPEDKEIDGHYVMVSYSLKSRSDDFAALIESRIKSGKSRNIEFSVNKKITPSHMDYVGTGLLKFLDDEIGQIQDARE